ncbi:hypothetical protein EVJ58_g6987 [Rhodofomes roseus]|uniref:Uncharacterized protein n=1 Tax=Rhodofomes roseus TaxID=34475 RepID=A0A4Y9Y562_9APHY|nr:hypothetical protein EVJ58_g6987 [Rhodofomes roseus]
MFQPMVASIEAVLMDAPMRLEQMLPMFWLNKPHPSLVGRGLVVNNSYLQVMDTCEEAATAWTEQDVHWPVPGETPANATDKAMTVIAEQDMAPWHG